MSKYILWDLDGTVVESENVALKSEMFSYASKTLNLEFNLLPKEFIGHEGFSIFNLILDRNKIINKTSYLNKYKEWYEQAVSFTKKNIPFVPLRENVFDIWHTVHNNGIKNAIVTSSREDVAKAYIKNIGLSNLCCHYTCLNHVLHPKPNPEPYLRAMSKINSNPSNCIVIEDSKSGITSAKSAGLYTIAWVKDKLNTDFKEADLVIDHLDFSVILKGLNFAEK